MASRRKPLNTLAIDIGGSGLKATVLDPKGGMVVERVRVATPVGAAPDKVVELLVEMVTPLPAYQRISVGFPGVVRDGQVRTAPNLGHADWAGYPLATLLAQHLGKPVRLANDADMQGLAVIAGRGVEMVLTLGTGFGTALFQDGRLGPHLELAHHPFRKGETYDQQLGDAARRRLGNKKWWRRVVRAIDNMRVLTTFDHLYLGGGNAKRAPSDLPHGTSIVANTAGLLGGIRLWDGA